MSEAREPSPEHRPRIRFGPKSVEAAMKAAPAGPVKMGRLPFRAKLGLAWVVFVIIVAIFAHWLSPYDPYMVGLTSPNTAPDWPEHIFGSDEIARDILSRVIHGSRMSALVAVLTPVLALILGGTIGMVAASTSRNRKLRWINDVLMRLVDIQFAFPAVVLAVVVSSAFGQSFRTLLLVLTVVYTPIMARYIRAAVLDQLGEDYVAALRAMGSSQVRILLRHVSLNIATPLLVFFTLVAADAVILEASISFLGAGLPPPAPTWGNLVYGGSQYLIAGTWWYTTFPGLAIFLTVLALNTVAESMADRLGGRRHLLGQ
ncbi:MAG: ABC transporter permease [Acidimicrobiia bacterium]|nr:ABC transporter permease [Acidimicrobiia bacterium]